MLIEKGVPHRISADTAGAAGSLYSSADAL
jgi:hypothetical protein